MASVSVSTREEGMAPALISPRRGNMDFVSVSIREEGMTPALVSPRKGKFGLCFHQYPGRGHGHRTC